MKFFMQVHTLLLVGLLSLATGCFEEPLATEEEETRIGDLLYRAEIIPEDTSLESDPMSLRAVVTVFNPTNRRVDLDVAGCTVWLRAYETDAQQRLLWEPEGECQVPPQTITFKPGASQSFDFYAYDVMLATALPDGLYYFTALARLADETIELPAGWAEVHLAVPGLRYDVETSITDTAPRSIHTTIAVTNENEETARLTYGACALNLLVYRTVDRSDPPVFDALAGKTCAQYLAIADLQPAHTLRADEFQLRVAIAEVLGDSLEAGRYYLTAILSHNWRTKRHDAGSVELTQ